VFSGYTAKALAERADPPARGARQRGRYHTDRQPFTLQNTAMCPAAPPLTWLGQLDSRTAPTTQ